MKNQVNKRVLDVKNHLNLTEREFCKIVDISTGTLHRAKNDLDLSPKSLNSIILKLNVSREWLFHGTGEMFSQAPQIDTPQPQNWKDAAFEAMREQIEILKNQNRFMQELIIQKLGVNFNFGVADLVGITDINIVSDSCNTVRVANLAA